MRTVPWLVCLGALAFLTSRAPAQSPSALYTFVDLGVDPSFGPCASSQPTAISASGQVVGNLYNNCRFLSGFPPGAAFVYANGVITKITGLGGGASASGINAFGAIVGETCVDSSCTDRHVFLYADGVMTDLGVPPGATQAHAQAINNSGEILGYSEQFVNGTFSNASTFLYRAGVWSDLRAVANLTFPVRLNNAGEIIARVVAGNDVLYTGGISVSLRPTPFDLNDRGDIIGIIGDAALPSPAGVLFSKGVLFDLGMNPRSINNAGQIVGNVGFAQEPALYASGTITDLASVMSPSLPAGWTFVGRMAMINDSGWIGCQIVGPASPPPSGFASSSVHACLLIPTTPAAPSVGIAPTSVTVTSGSSATFSAVANGNPVPTYQWQVSADNGATWTDLTNIGPYSGVTTMTLHIDPVSIVLTGTRYRAVATNSAGSVATTPATLTVTASAVAPTITLQPTSQATGLYASATLTVGATGTAPLSYQWSRDGTAIPGATHPTLQITYLQTAHSGAYTVTVTNSVGSVTSTPATLAVLNVVTPTSLRYAATKNGSAGALASVTAPQTVTVSFNGSSPAWSATADQSWIQLTNASGTGPGQFSVGIVNPSNVLGGSTSLSGTVTLTASSLGLTVPIPVNLTVQLVTTGTTPPTGYFDTPATGATNVRGSIAVTGWAMDAIGVNRVEIWRNCVEAIDRPLGACAAAVPGGAPNFVFIARGAFLAGARPDIEATFPTLPQAYRAGWGYLMMSNGLPHIPAGTPYGGQGSFTLSAYAINEAGQYTLLGTKTIALDNDHATIPFGAMDTPTEGGTVTANVSANFAWAMTQANKCIDTTSTSAYRVYIDGVSRTLTPGVNWFPGLNRSDIAAAFPGLCNTNNALAAYYIDATALGLANGLHTIGWDIIDNQGNIAGIGSRFFVLAR